MSLNFTGSTKKRQVNLGNRNLLAKNKLSFLQTAQQGRDKRERLRKETNAATTIQAALRAFMDLSHAHARYSSTWDGQNYTEFAFFFSHVVLKQNQDTSAQQLFQLAQHLRTQPPKSYVLHQLAHTLTDAIAAIVHAHAPETTTLSPLVAQILELLVTIEHLEPGTGYSAQLVNTLFKICDKNEFFLSILLDSAQNGSHEAPAITYEHIRYFLKPDHVFIDFAGRCQAGPRLLSYLQPQLRWIAAHKIEFKGLPSSQKFSYLVNVLTILFDAVPDYTSIVDFEFVHAFAVILSSIPCGLVFQADDEEDSASTPPPPTTTPASHDFILVSTDSRSKIEKLYMSDFARNVLRKSDTLGIHADLFVSFYYSLVQFISPRDDKINNSVNMALKNNLLVTLIVASSSQNFLNTWFQKLCDNEFYNQVLVLIEEQHYTISDDDELWDSAFSIKNESWWQTLYLFEELYSYLLYVSNDTDLFNSGRLSKEDYIAFVAFCKSFSIFIVLGGRNVSSSLVSKMDSPLYNNMLESFQKVGRLSVKLLKQIYLRDLRMKLVDEDFWLMKNSSFSTRSVAPLLVAIENQHEMVSDDEDVDEYGIDGGNGIDLFTTKGVKLFGKIGNHQQVDNLLTLTYLPFLLPFDMRAEIFHQLIELDKSKFGGWFPQKIQGTVSRENVLFDAFEQFGSLRGSQFKYPFSVEFINAFGEKEAGIDGGGLTKELLTSIVDNAFVVSSSNESQNGGLEFFKTTANYQLYPNPEFYYKLKLQQQNPSSDILNQESRTFYLQMMRFLGMVIGKCLYENVLTDISFAPFFLSRWSSITPNGVSSKNLMGLPQQQETQQHRISFDDLKTLDQELYQNLIKLLSLNEQELDSLDLNFSINEKVQDTQSVVNLNLIPGGSHMKVTQQNKLQYIYSIAKFKLDQSIAVQSNYFAEGLFEIIKPRWLSLFNPYELTNLISGGEKEIDIDDLKTNTVLGGFLFTDDTIKALFEILADFDNEEKSKFLKFVTSSSRAPLLGFKELNPKFGIRNSGSDATRLPTASTCINLLKLPDYKDKNLLREKLLYSINSHAGFDLS